MSHATETSRDDAWRWRALFLFGAGSLLAVGLGTVVMAQADVPAGIWMRNPIGLLVSAGSGVFLAQRGWLSGWMVPLALIVVALSLVGPGQDGVHRWLDLGPVQLNAAALVLPAAIAVFGQTSALVAAVCFVLMAGLLAWQPDISQLAAFAVAALILSAHRFGWRGAVAALVLAAGAIAFCLSRPDPLAPVAHVEGIFLLAWTQSPGLAILMAAGLAATALSPILLWPIASLMWPALALSAYFAVSALACLFGAYPAPLAGYGLSFVIGWCPSMFALSFSGLKTRAAAG